MLVKVIKDMVYRNTLMPAGTVFEFAGKTCPAACEPVATASAAKDKEKESKRSKKAED